MQNFKTIAALQAFQKSCKDKGETLALVPTMGALHDGHLSLVKLAQEKADHVIVSIFVNPAQFAPHEDFDAYPRVEDADAAMLAPMSIAGIFTPSVAEMYPEGFASAVTMTSALTTCLCGAARPSHFDGVATIVSKLLLQSRADMAVFGEKDWQQLQVIHRVNADLNIDCEIIGAPICRDALSGLALSSRNAYLSDAERKSAGQLNVILAAFAADIRAGRDIDAAQSEAKYKINAAGFGQIDYLECRTAQNLERVTTFNQKQACRVFVAAKMGSARLIDNMAV
jgi:pantoate--beta-alanine ligase